MQISQKRDMKRPYIHHVWKSESHKNLHLRLDNKSRLHNQTGPKLNSQPIQNQSTLKVEPNRTQPSGCLLTKPCTRKIRCAKNAVGKT